MTLSMDIRHVINLPGFYGENNLQWFFFMFQVLPEYVMK